MGPDIREKPRIDRVMRSWIQGGVIGARRASSVPRPTEYRLLGQRDSMALRTTFATDEGGEACVLALVDNALARAIGSDIGARTCSSRAASCRSRCRKPWSHIGVSMSTGSTIETRMPLDRSSRRRAWSTKFTPILDAQ